MKPKLLFAFAFLFLVQNSKSQTYIPMLNNVSWYITIANFGGAQNLVINPAVDVLIGSYTYKKFIDPTNNESVFLREDISTQRVYRNIEGNDQILYDFSLQVGNTILLSNGSNYNVVSITNLDVNGGTRRVINLSNGFSNEAWIESVGSRRHPLKPTYELPSDPYIYLTCSAQNGINIYNDGIANGQPTPTDCSMLLSVDDLNYVKKEIILSPNPFKSELSISSKSDFENGTLKILNSIGQIVRVINNINGKNIIFKRENLNSGIYFAQLIENNKVISNNKVIIVD